MFSKSQRTCYCSLN